jgi:hypothetical protein
MWFGNLSGPKKVAAVVVAAATGVSAVVGAVNGSIALYEKLGESSRAANPLELVDVGFTQVRHKEACRRLGECSVPAVDFKVANSGEGPVIIKRADVRVKKLWTFKAPYVPDPNNLCMGAAMLPSFNYGAKLPTKGAPYTVFTNLSQSIEPRGTDRFTITPHRDERTATSGEDYVFLVTISLIYGVENNAVTSPDLLYGEVSPDVGSTYAYHDNECYAAKEGLDNQDIDKLTMQNKQAVAEIRRIEAPRSETLEDLLQKVS